jgi:formylglycine-generating enzyme required for sulfatase activity
MRRMILRIVVAALLLFAWVPAFAQTPEDAAANRLFVEAVQLWNRAEGEPVTKRPDTFERVQSNLKAIIEQHPGSGLAVRLVVGERIGPLSMRDAEWAVGAARTNVLEVVTRPSRAAKLNGVSLRNSILLDCPECPAMVLIPAGSTRLASGRDVTINAPFMVGQFEVTFAEWDACASDGGCSHRPADRGWGRDRQPVMDVNWEEAQQFVAWLSRKTRKAYRLLSEAEWEYAAQAGRGSANITRFSADDANCDGCNRSFNYKQTAPVGSFFPNFFGLHDMLGNVWEWTADCWNASHDSAVPDSSARFEGDCSRRVARGGSWNTAPQVATSVSRTWGYVLHRSYALGFRVARAL